MKSRIATGLVVVAGLALTGATRRLLERPVGPAGRAGGPVAPLAAGGGPGVTWGVLGGFRTLAADLVWLRAYDAWEKRDAPATETLLELATALDPRPLDFWLNGARILACDLPAWRIVAEGGFDVVPPVRQARIDDEQARRALTFLSTARRYHPASAALWIEQANIELNRRHDLAAAADSYRRAAEQPGAPYYAARLHAELLRRLGRKREALAWLVKLHPQLPPDDEAAAAGVVLARIRGLERELAVAPGPGDQGGK